MKAPFHIEFQTETDEENVPFAIKDGYFLVEIDETSPSQFKKLASYLLDNINDDRDNLEKEFGAHDIQIKSGTLISWTSCDVEPLKFKQLLRKWRKAFEAAGFKTEDHYVVDRNVFDGLLQTQSNQEKSIIDELANGEVPVPQQSTFAFKM